MAIQFEEGNYNLNRFNSTEKTGSKMADFLIKQGVVKDPQSANMIMVIGALCMLGVSIYIFIFGFSLPEKQQTTPPSNNLPSGLEL